MTVNLIMTFEFGHIEISIRGNEAELGTYKFDAGSPRENVIECKRAIAQAEELCQKLGCEVVDNFPARGMASWAGSKLWAEAVPD